MTNTDDSVNQDQAQEALKEQITIVKQQIEGLRVATENANKVIGVIEDYQKNFDELRKKVDAAILEVQSNAANSTKDVQDIELLREAADKSLTQIKSSLAQVQGNIALVDTAYKTFQELNNKVIDPANGLDAVLKNTEIKFNEVVELKNQSSDLLNKIKDDLATVSKNIVDMNNEYSKFVEVQKMVFDKENGLESIFTDAETLKKDIEILKTDSKKVSDSIEALRVNSGVLDTEIANIKKKASDDLAKIAIHERESSELKEQINETLNAASDLSLASHFGGRKDDLAPLVMAWFVLSIVSIILLGVALYLLFSGKLPIENPFSSPIPLFIFRVTTLSPFLYLVYFTTTQYSTERNILERYAFKAATGLSITSYALLLNTKYNTNKENEKSILDFIIGSMKGIYQEPYRPFKEVNPNSKQVLSEMDKIKIEILNKIGNLKNIEETEQTGLDK